MFEVGEKEVNRYQIAAMLSECILFEYHIPTRTFYKFDSYGDILEDFNIIENFRYNEQLLSKIHKDDLERFFVFCNELDAGEDRLRLDLRIKNKIKVYQWFQIKGQVITDENNEPTKVIGRISNIDSQKREKDKLKERSERDPLTTLYNKETTELLINKYLKANEEVNHGTFLLIDFDNFKGINDNFGHLLGDSVLRDVSAQLRRLFRSMDVIGRVGGDEFVVYISGKTDEEAILAKVNDIHRIFDQMYADKVKQLRTSCSIGVAYTPKHGTIYKELFGKADIALYQAKNSGKACSRIYNDKEEAPKEHNFKNLYYDKYDARDDHIVTQRPSFQDSAVPYFNMLYFAEDTKESINLVMSMLGQEYSLNRINISEVDSLQASLKYTYEWVSEGIEPSQKLANPICPGTSEGYQEIFNEDGVFYSNDVEPLQYQSEVTYEHFLKKGVKAVIQCAIIEEGKFKGIIGYEICDRIYTWRKKDLDNLISLGRILGRFALGYQSKVREEKNRLMQNEIAKNQKLVSYVLKANTYELLDISEAARVMFPNARVGEICYKTFNNLDTPCEHCPLYGLSESRERSTANIYNANKNIRLKTTATRMTYEDQDAVLICSNEVTDLVETIQGKDELTGLPSLSKFEREANQRIKEGKQYAVLSLDIDKFKNINGTLGYKKGNQILLAFVNGIQSKLKSGELLCRSYADKFLLLLELDNIEHFVVRAKQIFMNAVNHLQNSFSGVHIVVAGGMYIIHEEDTEIQKVIDKANIARKSIKGSHISKLATYDNNIHNKVMKVTHIENRMVSAIKRHEFLVYYQPKVELKTNRIVGAEALVRWKLEDNNIMMPNEFIPIFEKNGFISQMDFYVYESVFAKMHQWSITGRGMFPISLNISRIHIYDRDFIHKMKELVNRYNIPPHMVELEITEGVFLNDKTPIIEVLNQLKEIGFILSIDDFGSGYSSLNLLRHLKMDVLKLDKDFFDQDIISTKESVVLVNVIRMSKELGMTVLSEGVETKEQAEYLASIGCDQAQGYYFAKPMSCAEFERFIYNY